MDSLRPDAVRHWTPDAWNITEAIGMAHGTVVDLGPGKFPLPVEGAVRVGWGWDGTDITSDRLPFGDQEVDFLYCRHTLEDLLDPCHTLREIARVAKSGWIETPSIVSEVARGVDGSRPDWRGYIHHRSMFWRSGDTLITAPKYAVLEYHSFNDLPIAESLEKQIAWNFAFRFTGPLKWKQLRHEVDYDLACQDYQDLIRGELAKYIREEAPRNPTTAAT